MRTARLATDGLAPPGGFWRRGVTTAAALATCPDRLPRVAVVPTTTGTIYKLHTPEEPRIATLPSYCTRRTLAQGGGLTKGERWSASGLAGRAERGLEGRRSFKSSTVMSVTVTNIKMNIRVTLRRSLRRRRRSIARIGRGRRRRAIGHLPGLSSLDIKM